VLERVNLVVEGNDFLGLVGPNGGGKTTLLRVLLGLLEPQQGRVLIFGEEPEIVRSRVGYVPQLATIDASVPAVVRDVVLMGRLSRSSWGPRFDPEQMAAAQAALEQAGAAALAGRRFGELSGGQQQRILIARALAADAELLILDEPTSGVDLHRERELLELLHRLNESLPIILVSHDVTLVSAHLKSAAWVNRTLTSYAASDLSPEVIERIFHEEAH
jgi:zinc transport system ATP-binding protein